MEYTIFFFLEFSTTTSRSAPVAGVFAVVSVFFSFFYNKLLHGCRCEKCSAYIARPTVRLKINPLAVLLMSARRNTFNQQYMRLLLDDFFFFFEKNARHINIMTLKNSIPTSTRETHK